MKKLVVIALVAMSLSQFTILSHSATATEQKVETREVTNEQMVQYYEKGMIAKQVRVIDSRPASKYVTGHIPGAISLPLEVLKKDPAGVDKLGIAKTDKIVFYCAGRECTLSADSAEIFRKLGYTDTSVYRNGVPGWNQKMQPLLAEEPFIRKGNLIIVDTTVGKETIVTPTNKTVQMSLDDLKGEKGKKLLRNISRNAPVLVVARADMAAVNEVLEELRYLDFRRLSYFPLTSWPDKLAVAPAIETLTWAPIYGPGQVAPKTFEEAAVAGGYILDVRPAADYATGHFKGSVNIPVEELEKGYSKVPKDKRVLVHCATGAKSQKAFDILGRKGYSNVMYLDAEISCKGESCTIKE